MSEPITVLLNVAPSTQDELRALRRGLREAGIPAIRDLTEAWFNVKKRGQRWAGGKYPEVEVYGAAYDRLDFERFMQSVLAVPWQYPRDMQLFVYRPDDCKFTIYEIVRGEWRELRRPRRRPASQRSGERAVTEGMQS